METVDVKFLGDIGKSDELGVLNGFRKLCEIYIQNLIQEGKWFTVCHKISSKQVDLMAITNSYDVKLGRMISDVFEEGSYRTSIYKYMLMNFLCYIEVPKKSYRSDTNDYQNTFEKILATANTGVMAKWLGVLEDDLPQKYRSRVYSIDFDDGDDNLPYVKLTENKQGVKKISCPKKDIDVSERGTRVIPLFMLKCGVDTLYSKLRDGIIKISFLKDGGQERDIFSTLNFNKLKEIYGEGGFLNDSVVMSYDGNFLENSAMSRGYIRVPEVGGSRYDTPTRSINYARIISISYDEKPDLSFIDIDLSTVVSCFEDCVVSHGSESGKIISMLEAFGIDGGCWRRGDHGEDPKYLSRDVTSLLQWVSVRKIILSTVFERDLCLFMLSNPQWFGEFTGKPVSGMVGAGNNVGLEL